MQTWHFTIRGPKGSPFEGGVYHGRIELPDEYPMKAPDFYFLTVVLDLCTHIRRTEDIQSTRRSVWTFLVTIWNSGSPQRLVRDFVLLWRLVDAMVRMIQAFMEDYSDAANGIGFIITSVDERKRLARLVVPFLLFHIVPQLRVLALWEDHWQDDSASMSCLLQMLTVGFAIYT